MIYIKKYIGSKEQSKDKEGNLREKPRIFR